MRSIRAMFKKQLLDTMKNRFILIQFIIMPVMAFLLNSLVDMGDDGVPANMFVTMFAAIFIGMGPVLTTSGAISEDKERKSLRFLVMAGVRQHDYLLGVGGFIMLVCAIISVFFGLISGYQGTALIKFILFLIFGAATSTVLGAAIGIFSKNQQQATAISVPIFIITSFCPLIAQFNEKVAKIAMVLYTQQINEITADISLSALKPFLITLANLVVFSVLFAIAYKKKGIKG